MEEIKVKAIVLKSLDYKEKDKLLTIFKEKLTKTEFFSLTFSIISVIFGLL